MSGAIVSDVEATAKKFCEITPEELISIDNINEIDFQSIRSEIEFYSTLATERAYQVENDPNFRKDGAKKDDLIQKVMLIGDRAMHTSRLIRVLFRLAKQNSDSKTLCEEVISKITPGPALISPAGSSRPLPNRAAPISQSYARVTKSSTIPEATSEKVVNVPKKQASPEITLIPKNDYNSDLKKLTASLKSHQVNSVRKSRNGNIVLRCEDESKLKRVTETLNNTDFVQVKTMEKNLPRMTVYDVGDFESNEALLESILCKNSSIKALIDDNKAFQILFFKKWKGNTNVVIKVDPAIRDIILANRSKVFIGLKCCHVSDSFPFKICYTCQKTCSHLSNLCPEKENPTCRYCCRKHDSKVCPVRNESSKHMCKNCSESNIESVKRNAHSHFSNSNNCPLIQAIIINLKANTDYEQKNS